MILKFEIIIYCGDSTIMPTVDGQLFSKDFIKKDHDIIQGAIELCGANVLRDYLTEWGWNCRSF
jgi:hypothetical protein